MKNLKRNVEIDATDIVLTFEEIMKIKSALIWAEVLAKKHFKKVEKEAKECTNIINDAIINR